MPSMRNSPTKAWFLGLFNIGGKGLLSNFSGRAKAPQFQPPMAGDGMTPSTMEHGMVQKRTYGRIAYIYIERELSWEGGLMNLRAREARG